MNHHNHLDELAWRFFHVFSRTEYALKASGINFGDGPAEANWRDFALAVDNLIADPSTPELEDAVNFIFNAPPEKQVILGGVLQWKASEPETDSRADKLLIYVRRVRNNLFHGGKFNGRWFEPQRSEPLMRHSLVILSSCVEEVASVREAFHG